VFAPAQAVYQVVETALEQEQEVLARDTLLLRSAVEQVAELLLVQAVHVAKLLLFLQLHAVSADLAASVGAVLTRRERAFFQFFSGTAQGDAQAAA